MMWGEVLPFRFTACALLLAGRSTSIQEGAPRMNSKKLIVPPPEQQSVDTHWFLPLTHHLYPFCSSIHPAHWEAVHIPAISWPTSPVLIYQCLLWLIAFSDPTLSVMVVQRKDHTWFIHIKLCKQLPQFHNGILLNVDAPLLPLFVFYNVNGMQIKQHMFQVHINGKEKYILIVWEAFYDLEMLMYFSLLSVLNLSTTRKKRRFRKGGRWPEYKKASQNNFGKFLIFKLQMDMINWYETQIIAVREKKEHKRNTPSQSAPKICSEKVEGKMKNWGKPLFLGVFSEIQKTGHSLLWRCAISLFSLVLVEISNIEDYF